MTARTLPSGWLRYDRSQPDVTVATYETFRPYDDDHPAVEWIPLYQVVGDPDDVAVALDPDHAGLVPLLARVPPFLIDFAADRADRDNTDVDTIIRRALILYFLGPDETPR